MKLIYDYESSNINFLMTRYLVSSRAEFFLEKGKITHLYKN